MLYHGIRHQPTAHFSMDIIDSQVIGKLRRQVKQTSRAQIGAQGMQSLSQIAPFRYLVVEGLLIYL